MMRPFDRQRRRLPSGMTGLVVALWLVAVLCGHTFHHHAPDAPEHSFCPLCVAVTVLTLFVAVSLLHRYPSLVLALPAYQPPIFPWRRWYRVRLRGPPASH